MDLDVFAAVVPPLVILVAAGIGGLISWSIKSQAEELRAVEERLREDRRRIYAEVIEPFVMLLSGITDPTQQANAEAHLTSFEYRRSVFELSLYGGDNVIQAYVGFLRLFWDAAADGVQPDSLEGMRRFGVLLLALRRDLGNKNSDLDEWDMLRTYIRDIDRKLADLAG